MRIGIDMRMAGTGEGIGRYIEELVKQLAVIDSENEYFLLFSRKSGLAERFDIRARNFHKVAVASPYYSVLEQTYFIYELSKLHLDIVHFASFNAPIFYRGKFIVTIHDIIHHFFPGRKKTRILHRLAYRLVIASSVKQAVRIITVTENTKKTIESALGVDQKKIEVVSEGVDGKFFERLSTAKIRSTFSKYRIDKPYILFTGVWRQYKNLERLARAFDILKDRYKKDCLLVLVGKADPYNPQVKNAIWKIKNVAHVRALGFVPDSDLMALYQGAAVFALPSLIEGFGLIGIEAQASGTAVAASDIPVLREILGDGALFFDPAEESDMAYKLHSILTNEEKRKHLVERGTHNAKKYNWAEAAKQTLAIYQRVLKV